MKFPSPCDERESFVTMRYILHNCALEISAVLETSEICHVTFSMDGQATSKATMSNNRPTREELNAAKNKTVPDVIDHNLSVLFCGMNPGLYSAAVGHHF